MDSDSMADKGSGSSCRPSEIPVKMQISLARYSHACSVSFASKWYVNTVCLDILTVQLKLPDSAQGNRATNSTALIPTNPHGKVNCTRQQRMRRKQDNKQKQKGGHCHSGQSHEPNQGQHKVVVPKLPQPREERHTMQKKETDYK